MNEVEVRRSKRRKKSVQAYREAGKTIVLIPAHFTKAQEHRYVKEMIEKLDRAERRHSHETDLVDRAKQLNEQYFNGAARASDVTWVSNQNTRWASCTYEDRTIRVSDRMIGMPAWVIDYVLVHELAHLIEPNHSPRFYELVSNFPDTEKAQAFLAGYSFGR